jgi:UDP-N-acetylglucosamine/UDP-N-acetylgalactosamine diphosphorylase
MAKENRKTPSERPGSVEALLARGVRMPHPASVWVDPAVDPERVAPGVTVHAGCRLAGAETSIGPGCVLGAEGPATVKDCRLGRDVQLGGGCFAGSVFLDGAALGGSAHVRPGCLLEEGAGAGHAAGFKQTILMPFVTAGSLVNACDLLMAGGTGPKDHGEIGSSYVHFNFTPQGDKATASLLGDVPRGVMLDCRPVFLGGQGGIVGPVRVAYGCVVPAGTILRRDALREGQLAPAGPPAAARPYDTGVYTSTAHKIANNLAYLGNLRALEAWYAAVRVPTMAGDPFARACGEGALGVLAGAVDERIKRLGQFARKLPASIEALRARGEEAADERAARQEAFAGGWPSLEAALRGGPPENAGAEARARFAAAWEKAAAGRPYLEAVRALPADARQDGTAWLQAIVDSVANARN